MEKVGEIIKRQQVGNNLPALSTTHLTTTKDGLELTIYRGGLTAKGVSHNVAKIKAAFPSLPPDFFTLLIERLKEKGFSDERAKDAVNNVIDTCQYPTPTLANFLSFDRRVKILTYQELISKVTEGEASFNNYERIKIKGKIHFVKTSDKEMFNIPSEL